MTKQSLVPVLLPADPVNVLEAATKQYVDAKGGGVAGYPSARGEWNATSGVTVPVSTWTGRTWLVFDAARPPVGMAYVSNGQVRVDVEGWYVLTGVLTLTTATGGRRLSHWSINGNYIAQVEHETPTPAAALNRGGMNNMVVAHLSAGDMVAFEVYHTVVGGIAWETAPESAYLSITRLADGAQGPTGLPGPQGTVNANITRVVYVPATNQATLSGTAAIEGITVAVGDLILLVNQTTQSQNGVYTIAAGAWTRTSGFDTAAGLTGAIFQGLQNSNNTLYKALNINSASVIGTSALTFEEIWGLTQNDLRYQARALTTKGDLLAGTGSNVTTRLPVGTANQVLGADPTALTGLVYVTPNTCDALCVATSQITQSGTQTIDGVAVVAGNTVLCVGQTAAAQNGLWTVAAGAWARLTSFDTAVALAGVRVGVGAGTSYGGTHWVNTFKSTDTLNTTAQVWVQPGQDLSLDLTTGNPVSPLTGLRMFTRDRARRLPAFVSPSGQDSRVQPHIVTNKAGWLQSVNNSTTPTINGLDITHLNAGTAVPTAVAMASTNFFTSMVRTRYATTAAANIGSGIRTTTAQYFASTTVNMGGFHYICRFGLNAAAATSRGFFGLNQLAAVYTPGVNPSTLLQQIGFYWDAAQTTLRFIASGSVAGTPVDLGANFPVSTAATNFYEVALFVPSGSGQYCRWAATRINDGVYAGGVVGSLGGSGSTTFPTIGTLLAGHAFYGTGTGTGALSMDVQSLYLESDN
jgi:hypothetical protein